MAIIFKKFDRDNDGVIGLQQLKEAYGEIQGNDNDEDCDHVLNKVDKNKSGKIDFSEFLIAVYDRKKLFVADSLMDAFDYLDENKTGYL